MKLFTVHKLDKTFQVIAKNKKRLKNKFDRVVFIDTVKVDFENMTFLPTNGKNFVFAYYDGKRFLNYRRKS